MSALEEIKKVQEEYQRTLDSVGRAAVLEIFKSYFEKNPEVRAARTHMYVPSFNDGEPCSWTFGGVEVLRSEDEDWEDAYTSTLYDDLESQEDLLEEIFGDNVQVTVQNDSGLTTSIEDYDPGY